MRRIVLAWIVVLILSIPAYAIEYLSPEMLKQWLESGKQVIIVDIQTMKGYTQHHIRGSIMTNAYPCDTPEELGRLDTAIKMIKRAPVDVVVVRAGGKMGRISSYRAHEYLLSKGVPASRLYILEGGIGAWPYPELLE